MTTRVYASPNARRLAAVLGLLSATTARAEPRDWRLDPVHTRVLVAVSHDGFSQALGTVSGSTGWLRYDPADPAGTRLLACVPLDRLDFGDTDWNRAVARLLGVERHPIARFVVAEPSPAATPDPIQPEPNQPDPNQSSPNRSAPTQTSAIRPDPTRPDPARPDLTQPDPHRTDASTPAGAPAGPPTISLSGTLVLHGVRQPMTLTVTLNRIGRMPLPPFRERLGASARGTLQRAAFGVSAWPSLIGATVSVRIEAEAEAARAPFPAPADLTALEALPCP